MQLHPSLSVLEVRPHCCSRISLLQKALDHKYRYFRRAPVQEADQNFHVGLQLCSSGHQSFNKLIWIHHSCHITYK